MDQEKKLRLRILIRALMIELDRQEWDDVDAVQTGPHEEVDLEFDLMPSGDENVVVIDQDHPDETDRGPVGPLCVECGNYGQSCIC